MDIEKLTELVKKAQGSRSQNEFALHSEVSSATITKILKSERLPSPKILKRLANKAHNGITYEQLMQAAGYINSEIKETEEDYLEHCRPIHGNVMQRLQELRLSKNITTKQLGKDFNVPARTVSQWETGFLVPDTKTTIDLANYFDVSVEYLVGRSNYPYGVEDTLDSLSNNPELLFAILGKVFNDKVMTVLKKMFDRKYE